MLINLFKTTKDLRQNFDFEISGLSGLFLKLKPYSLDSQVSSV